MLGRCQPPRLKDLTVIRVAEPNDASALTAVGRETFTQTFGHLYPPQDLTAYLASAYTDEAYGRWIADPAYGVWIAKDADRTVGYAVTGPCDLPHPDVTKSCGELKRLYLLKDAQGSGTGGRLLDLCLETLGQPGRRLWIGVWSENFGAQRLYGRHGFVKVGEYEMPIGEVRDRPETREFILSRPAALDSGGLGL